MSEPIAIEWDVGQDAYGRHVKLKRGRTYDGKWVWSITSEPVSQRDEGERIQSLSIGALQSIAAIVKDFRP